MFRMNELAPNHGKMSKIPLRLDAHVSKVTQTLCSVASLSDFESKFNFTDNVHNYQIISILSKEG